MANLTNSLNRWKSESFVASVVVTLTSIGAIVGHQVSSEMSSALTNTIVALVTGVGGLVALIGRFKATKRLK